GSLVVLPLLLVQGRYTSFQLFVLRISVAQGQGFVALRPSYSKPYLHMTLRARTRNRGIL
ncbi:MAG: hypothetical protein J6S36_07285, partial [Eggerthellaceae bacterium]|nr:hypothetical protein [Eggerthellaceae bacterium]